MENSGGINGIIVGGGIYLLVAGVVFILFVIVVAVVAIMQNGRKSLTGRDEMIGMKAYAREKLDPEGEIFIRSELWRAKCEEGVVNPGERVVVKRIDGLTLIVEKDI